MLRGAVGSLRPGGPHRVGLGARWATRSASAAPIASYNRDGFGENLTTGADHYNKDVLAARVSAEWAPTD